MDPLASFTFETFRDRVGETFDVDGVPLVLESAAAELPTAGVREGGAFALLFRGPGNPSLPQATHPVAHEELGEFALFLVPVGRDPAGTQYQAVFN